MAPSGWLPVRSTRPVSGRSESTLRTHVLNGAYGLATCSLDQASERQAREYIAYTCAEWRLVGYLSARAGQWSTGQRVHCVQVFKKTRLGYLSARGGRWATQRCRSRSLCRQSVTLRWRDQGSAWDSLKEQYICVRQIYSARTLQYSINDIRQAYSAQNTSGADGAISLLTCSLCPIY